jgi:hypothetical protein
VDFDNLPLKGEGSWGTLVSNHINKVEKK